MKLQAAFAILCFAQPASASVPPPPNSFDLATEIGVIDYIGPSQPDNFLLFRCFFRRVVLNPSNNLFNTSFFRFSVMSSQSLVYINLDESPATSMWLRTYDSQRRFIKEYKSHDHEVINEVFSQGTYYLQVLTDGNVPHGPGGSNTGSVTFQGRAGPNQSDLGPEPTNLGILVAGSPINHSDALSFVTSRDRTFRSELINKDCPSTGVGLVDDRDEFILTSTPGKITVQIAGTFDQQNWSAHFVYIIGKKEI